MSFLIGVAFLLEYNGSEFSGSQLQKHRSLTIRTVQAVFTEALLAVDLPPMSPIWLASRTDAGVHAKGQVAYVVLEASRFYRYDNLLRALNNVLPSDLAVKQIAAPVDARFHPLRSAVKRWYRYSVVTTPYRPVLCSPDCTWMPQPLDVAAMQQASKILLGQHCFTSFKCPDTAVKDDVCHLYKCEWKQITPELLVLDIISNRYLYKMVRIIAGTLLEVGLKREEWPIERVKAVLDARDRNVAGKTAPAEGLCLMAIAYPSSFNYFHDDILVRALEPKPTLGVNL